MAGVHDIVNFWRRETEENVSAGLAVDFKELVDMRRYVSYLKETKFNQSALHAGDAKSAFKGRGMEFEEVRAYAYGDDVRDVDWRVTARKNQPYTKLYSEEKDREVYAWVDLSPDMVFGTRKELKSVTAAKIAALLGWFALDNKDRFGAAIYDGFQTRVFEPRRTQENLLFILKQLAETTVQGIKNVSSETEMELHEEAAAKSLQKLQSQTGRRSIVFVISSFENFAENFARQLSSLSHNHEVFAVNVYDVLEDVAPPPGEYMAQLGLEKQLLISTGGEFSSEYHNFFAQKRQKIKDFCAKFNCRYRQVRTDLPVYKQLRPV